MSIKEFIRESLKPTAVLNQDSPLFRAVRKALLARKYTLSTYFKALEQSGCPDLEDQVFRIIDLMHSNKRVWKSGLPPMSAFEYALNFDNPEIFLFYKKGCALVVLLIEYLKDAGPQWFKDRQNIGDNAGRILEKNFKKYTYPKPQIPTKSHKKPPPLYGLPEWDHDNISLSQPDNIKNLLKDLSIPYIDFRKLTYLDKIRLILKEISEEVGFCTPLTRAQILGTIQRIMGVSVQEIPLEKLSPKNKDGETISQPEDTVVAPGQFPAQAKDNKAFIEKQARVFLQRLTLQEQRVLKLREHDRNNPVAFETICQTDRSLGSPETIRQTEKKILKNKMVPFLRRHGIIDSDDGGLFLKIFLGLL